MPAPFPYDAVAKRLSLGQIARAVLGHYKWLARWSDEIGSDPDLDLKKLAQLSFVHCRLFRVILDPFLPLMAGAPFVVALRAEFTRDGLAWSGVPAMISDLSALHTECGSLFVFVRDNVAEAREFAKRTYDALGEEIEVPVKVAKPHAAVTEVAKLRALFE